MPEELDGYYISESYLLLKINHESLPDDLKTIEETKLITYMWSILRTSELGGEFLSCTTGMGRQNLDWLDDNKGISKLMIPIKIEIINSIHRNIKEVREMESKIQGNLTLVSNTLNSHFDVESEESKVRLEATKPPSIS